MNDNVLVIILWLLGLILFFIGVNVMCNTADLFEMMIGLPFVIGGIMFFTLSVVIKWV